MNRLAIAVIFAYLAVFGIPKGIPKGVTVYSVRDPSSEMATAVGPVAEALASASPADKALFADVWLKAGKGIRGEEESQLVSDTRVLRDYARVAATIGWKRIGGLSGKYKGLDEACNKAFASVIGMDVKPMDSKLRGQFDDLTNALAWAALRR